MSKVMEYVDTFTQDINTRKLERVAAYIRVSTQEQKLHGISLDAQRDKLKEYAEKHGLKIVAWYEDEGVSGRKLIRNRPALQKMLKDAQAKLFDRIIFIKLDRFFRSVAEYHECMKMIDPVLWTATEEKYDLTTANGRAFVNMKLTIAELEADQTGERIDIVNDYKIKTGQAITGAHCQGYGYTVQKDKEGVKRVVKDPETAHVVDEYIQHFLQYHNKKQAYLYVRNKYNLNIEYNSLSKILSDTKLCGSYRGNDNYIAEPYVDMETFLRIQELQKVNIKKPSTNRVYLYTGLVICPSCGKKMTGKYIGGVIKNKKPSGKLYTYERNYYYYRCNKHHTSATCSFKKQINENIIEKALLSDFDQYVNNYLTELAIADNTPNIDNDRINERIKEIKLEMKNTTTAFRKGRMTEKEYDKEYDELEAQLNELEAQIEPVKEIDLTIYKELLKSDWKELYGALTRENKRSFWRKYIKQIIVDKSGKMVRPIFF